MASTLASRRSDRSVQPKRGAKNADDSNSSSKQLSLKTFEPARKKLTSIESQRLVNTLDECVEKLQVAALVSEVVLDDIDRFQTMLGDQTTEALREEAFLIDKFTARRRQVAEMYERQKIVFREVFPWSSSGADGAPSGESVVAALRGVESRLRSGVRRTLRRLTKGGDANAIAVVRKAAAAAGGAGGGSGSGGSGGVGGGSGGRGGGGGGGGGMAGGGGGGAGVGGAGGGAVIPQQRKQQHHHQQQHHPRSPALRRVIESIIILRNILFERFLTSPMEDEERHQFLREVSIRDKKNVVIVDKLERELATAVGEKEVEVSKRNDVIRRLQIELNNVEKAHEENVRRTKMEAEKQESADMKNSEGKKQKLLHEIAQLKAQVTTITAEHRESELTMRKRKFKAETEVENLIQKYDEDIGEKQTEFDVLNGVYVEEKSQLLQLEERFAKLEEEYLQIMEEKRIEKEKREAQERLLLVQNKAAISIQAYWRSFKCRKMLKGKKKKGKSKSSRKKDK